MNKQLLSSISGFPELTPSQQIVFDRMIDIIKRGYESVGAIPISTPIVERSQLLEDKGLDAKEIYALTRLDDTDFREPKHALRFDLTVPMCRYVAQHKDKLQFPFRRYQIQPVWRGERAQKLRYREFWQADIDVIGLGSLDLLHDAEVLSVVNRILNELKIGEFQISINNRKLFNGLLAAWGIVDPEQFKAVVEIIDNSAKVDPDASRTALVEANIDERATKEVMEVLSLKMTTKQALEYVSQQELNPELETGISELKRVYQAALNFGVSDQNMVFDPTIVRGLDYYTGTVFETFLIGRNKLSVCSGGRYENLVRNLIGAKENMPGVGVSIGISRLFYHLWEAKLIDTSKNSISDVLILRMGAEHEEHAFRFASRLRNRGIACECYLENASRRTQLRYATKKGFRWAVTVGDGQTAGDAVIVRNMRDGESVEYAADEALNILSERAEQ